MKVDFGMSTAGSLIGDGNIVRRRPSYDERMRRIQPKNIGPPVSLTNNEVCRRIVWLHHWAAEITLRGENLSD